ncbi:MAG: HTH domain-containing protein [Clostridia bacterium]|nr:HTH domain-containing protein [Clostridia bacterium]
MSEIEVEVLSGIHKEPHLSAKKIANQIGVTDRTVERAIHTLKDSGFIKREGSNRGK